MQDRFASPNIVSCIIQKSLICVAILYKSGRHYSYKAEDDFLYSEKALELEYKPFIYIRDNKSSIVEL